MTKVSRKFVREVGALLVETQVIDDLVILPPTKYLVRGFLLDGTPRKNNFRLIKLVVPLFSPFMENLSLNFSDSLVVDGRSYPELVLEAGADHLPQQVATLLKDRFCAELGELGIPEFLQHYEAKIGTNRPNVALEFAIGRLLIGEIGNARLKLQEIAELSGAEDHEVIAKSKVEAKRLLQAMDEGGRAVELILEEHRDRIIAKHFPGLILDQVAT